MASRIAPTSAERSATRQIHGYVPVPAQGTPVQQSGERSGLTQFAIPVGVRIPRKRRGVSLRRHFPLLLFSTTTRNACQYPRAAGIAISAIHRRPCGGPQAAPAAPSQLGQD